MATYDVTPVNGGANAVGTLEKTAQINGFLISLDSASDGTDDAPVDLRAVDAAHGSTYDLILRELNPLMAHAINDATGVMSVIMDAHHGDAASIKARLVQLDGIGTDTTVAAAASFAVA
ncbi:hypothetical protein N9I97_00105 [bacterium]|jgi:hypothetical protein|nr:hypothetical protein [bacterium]